MIRTTVLLSLLAGSALRAEIPVRGQVLDPEGRPLAAVEVALVRAPTPWERLLLTLDGRVAPDPEEDGRTGEDGWFELMVPGADVWEISVSATGYIPMTTGPAPLLEETMLEPVVLVRNNPLTVRVLGMDGRPLPDVWVSAPGAAPAVGPPGRRSAWRPRPAQVRTDTAGRAVLWRRGGDRLDVTAYPPAGSPIDARQLRGGETLRAGAAGSQRFRLVGAGGAPLPGAVAIAGPEGWPIGRTDAGGELEVQRKPEDPLRVAFVLADGRRASLDVEPGLEPAAEGESTRRAATTVRPEAPRRLTGRVIDARTREPLADAIVYAGTDAGRRTQTHADGSFELLDPPPGSRWLTAAASGHSATASDELDGPATIALPPTWTVRGVVLDATREPLAGTVVVAFPRVDSGRLLASAWGSSTRALSGSNGSFELSGLREGLTYTVAAELPGRGHAEEVVRQDEAHRLVHLVLATGSTLVGQLLDETDAPVGGAILRLHPSSGGDPLFAWTARLLDPRAPAETTTDAEGGFAWEHLRPGTWDLAVSTRGYAEETVSGIELEEGRVHDLGLLRLTPGTPLAGRVQDADGAPLEGAQVRLTVPSTFAASFADEPAPDAVSDPDGWFSIPDRRAGERLDLEVRRDGFVRRDLPGVVVEDHPLVVALEPAAGLTGVVVGDDGAPVSRAFVTAHGEGGTAGPGGRVWADLPVANTVTDEEGLFELADLPAGHLRLLVRAEGYRLEERTGIEVETGAKEQALTIRLRRGALVQGRVAASDGSPVSGASVSVVEETGGRWMSGATTDGDGRYRLDGVEPGRRTVGAVAEDGRSTRRELEVIDGANTLDLAFEPGWPVAGTVLDAAGAPVADAFLTLAAESTAWAGIEARTDEHGAFRFEDVREGTYWLRARHRRYAMTRLEDPVEVAGPVADVELRLASGARIVGTLSGLEEVELRQSEVIAYDRRTGTAAGRIAPDGGFVIPALAPGDWTVLASAPGGRRATDHVAIAPGEEEIRVDLSFGDGFTLEGTVLLESEPLSGAQVALRNQDIADSAWSRTDHLGRFQADGLEPGRYSLVVSKFDSGLHHQEELLLLDDEEVLIEIERRRVSGRVVDAVDEAPVAGAAVRLQPHDVDPALFPTSTRGPGTRSDSSGAFSLGSVTAGLHELSVSKDGYGRLEQALEVVGDVEGLVLRLEPTEGLALRVRLPDGSPARQVSVVALDPWSGQPLDGGRFLATSDGDVRLASLPPGRWILLVGAADAAVAEVTLTAPGEGESVQLGLGTRLEIVVPSLTGPVVPAATVALERPTGEPFRHPGSGELRLRWPLWNGRSAVENLPAGPWIIHVEATDGRRWDETISVEAGGTQKVELD